jgi:hypothetical protein
MLSELAENFRPVAPPRIIEDTYTAAQHARLMEVVRSEGPWSLILAENFEHPEEVIATTSGEIPEGIELTWDMLLTNPVFRGYLSRQGVCFYPEIEDCYYNSRFLELARGYWGARYAEPETYLFNIQGPTPIGGPPHLDGTVFRGMTMENTPLWLLLSMAKSCLFRSWQAKKAQVIAWYYKGRIGGGFNCWPDGPTGVPLQIQAPMWGRGVVVENEMMFHHGQACGPVAMRAHTGLDITSVIETDPDREGGWRIVTGEVVNQRIAPEEMRFLVHWGARVFMDFEELKVTFDHTDDITADRAIEMLIDDIRRRNVQFETPTDPMNDRDFVKLLAKVYDIGGPANIPPDAVDEIAA